MRVAPQKEVMIGISNYNLVNTGQLVSFLEVILLRLCGSRPAEACGLWQLLARSSSRGCPGSASLHVITCTRCQR